MANVADDAGDRAPRLLVAAGHLEALADGAAAGKKLRAAVWLRKIAGAPAAASSDGRWKSSAHQRDAERLEVSRCDHIPVRGAEVAAPFDRAPFHVEAPVARSIDSGNPVAAPGNSAPGRCRSDRAAGRRTRYVLLRGIARQRQRHPHRQDVVGAQPGRHAHQVDEAPHRRGPAAIEERERNGDLRDDQRGADASPHAVGRAAPAGGDRIDDAIARIWTAGRDRRGVRCRRRSPPRMEHRHVQLMSATRGNAEDRP